MKYCYECGRMTAGEPLFCNSCGRSYDVKLCPRLHVNPRSAEVCSQCGNRELSTPQPRVSLVWRLLGFLAKVVIALLLAYVLLAFLYELFTRPETGNALVALGFLFGALWVLWGMVPEWLRKAVRWSLGKGGRGLDR
jgi:hypothetical protein